MPSNDEHVRQGQCKATSEGLKEQIAAVKEQGHKTFEAVHEVKLEVIGLHGIMDKLGDILEGLQVIPTRFTEELKALDQKHLDLYAGHDIRIQSLEDDRKLAAQIRENDLKRLKRTYRIIIGILTVLSVIAGLLAKFGII